MEGGEIMNFKISENSSFKSAFTGALSKMKSGGMSGVAEHLNGAFAHKKADGTEAELGISLLKLTFFLTGFLCSLCFCWIAENMLMSRSLEERLILAESVAHRAPSFANASIDRSFGGLAKLNPFNAAVPPEEKESQASAYPVTSLMLSGTLPNIGAWITDDTGTHLVLKGQEIKGYKLDEIHYGKIVLSSGSTKHEVFLVLSGGAIVPPPPRPDNKKSGLDLSSVVAAGSGKEGSVPRELIDKLLMNPYDEVAKMRMIPAEGGGMQLERIAPDSVLGTVGVVEGDVIKALNGVTITNMGDIANAVNSMMAGTRFDVSVMRGGKAVDLKYQVK